MQELFEYCIRSGKIPDTWKDTRLMLVLKENRERAYPGSYCPIALLNIDYKSLTSIMAERLNKVIGAYVAEDKTGFYQG